MRKYTETTFVIDTYEDSILELEVDNKIETVWLRFREEGSSSNLIGLPYNPKTIFDLSEALAEVARLIAEAC